MSRRLEKVNELIRQDLSAIILQSIRDPRVHGLLSITAVDTSPDLAHAIVYVSGLGTPEQRQEALAGLRRAAGFLRHELRGKLSIRQVPQIDFRLDETIERGARVYELLDQLGPIPAPE